MPMRPRDVSPDRYCTAVSISSGASAFRKVDNSRTFFRRAEVAPTRCDVPTRSASKVIDRQDRTRAVAGEAQLRQAQRCEKCGVAQTRWPDWIAQSAACARELTRATRFGLPFGGW